MKLTEKINYKKLEKVIKCKNIPIDDDESDNDKKWRENLRKILKEYPKDCLIKYTRKNNFGRYQANGLQKMPCEIRKYVSDGIYIDIDISNCHPVILEQLFKTYEITIPDALRKYNENRNMMIKEYQLKTKIGIFYIMYKEQYTGNIKELKDLHETIYKKLLPELKEDYQEIYKTIEKDANKNGCFISLVLQDIENEILMVLFNKCKELNIEVGALVFDGLMITKETYKKEYLNILEREVKKKLKYIIKLIEKSMETDWEPEFNEIETNLEELEKETKDYISKNYEDHITNVSLNNDIITVKAVSNEYLKCVCEKMNGDYILSKEGSFAYCKICEKRYPKHTELKINTKYTNLIQYFQIVAQNVNINVINTTKDECVENIDDLIFSDDKIQNELMKHNLKFQSNVTLLKIITYYIKKYENIDGIYDYKYIGVKEKNQIWYKWTGCKWIMETTGSPKMPKIYEMIRNDYENAMNKTDKTSIKAQLQKVCKTCGDSSTFAAINSTWMYEFPPEKDGDEIFDMNPYLIGFENGVFDFKTKTFRKQSKNDFVSMSVGYEYIPQGNGKKEMILDFFKSVIPNEENRNFLLKTLASCLIGVNKEERLGIFTGLSRNGKGVLSELMENTLGDYYGAGSGSFVQNERPSSDRPQPDLINYRKKRLVILNEVDEKRGLNIQFTKNLVGNDIIPCRGLFSNIEIQVRAQFKLILNCNQRPIMDSDRMDLWSKVYLLEFPVTFVDDPKDIKNEYQKLKNNNLKSILKEWKVDMMNILIEYYDLYEKQGLQYTEEIKNTVTNERRNNDSVQDFIDEYIEFSEGNNLKLSDVMAIYNAHNPKISKLLFKNKMILKCKITKTHGTDFIRNYKFKLQE